MASNTSIETAQIILKASFIGPTELLSIQSVFPLSVSRINKTAPAIPWSSAQLETVRDTHVLILGCPETQNNDALTLNFLRAYYGVNPDLREPCFYNQDWYLHEEFASTFQLSTMWYLLRKDVLKESRAAQPQEFTEKHSLSLPSALLTAYTFFAYYFLNHKSLLWEHDFVWCNDVDHNRDQIYTGRYHDPDRVNKNGFNIHRYLSIRENYGIVETL